MRRMLLWILCIVLAMPLYAGRAAEMGDGEVSLRALLVGCDYFITQDTTAPAARSNVRLLAEALLRDSREYRRIMTAADRIGTVEELRQAVERAYTGADADDVSLFYISTHGVFRQGSPVQEAALLLSDGDREEKLYADELQQMLDKVPGKKLLILDACNSGAFIGKGLSRPYEGDAAFSGDDYKVLCSAGGSEESWYWKSQDDGDPNVQYGASYFATVLAAALSPQSAADMNADGQITLQEMYRHLLDDYAASTPQVYPQEDDFALFVYDEQVQGDHRVISGLSFDDEVLLPGQKNMTFSFTLHEETSVYYQLIYYRDGAWDFGHAQMISDSELTGGDTSPGRKMRMLSLETDQLDTAGYVMLLLITREDHQLQMLASKLLCVQPAQGNMRISVKTARAFCPSEGEEMSIVVNHDMPCSLSVTIQDMEGNVVRRLSYSTPSRPQSFDGSTFCWNGKKSDGTYADPGQYVVTVQTSTGGVRQTVTSRAFQLLD